MAGTDAQANGHHSNGDAGSQPARPAAAGGLSFAGLSGPRARPRAALAVHGPAAAARREAISGFGEDSNGPVAAPDKPVIPKQVGCVATCLSCSSLTFISSHALRTQHA